jgi:hypothetical protein
MKGDSPKRAARSGAMIVRGSISWQGREQLSNDGYEKTKEIGSGAFRKIVLYWHKSSSTPRGLNF